MNTIINVSSTKQSCIFRWDEEKGQVREGGEIFGLSDHNSFVVTS